MEIINLIRVMRRQELRDWLEANSNMESDCWVIVSMTDQSGFLQYIDAVEEAICFGWIDGIKKKISDSELVQRISPRKIKSNWT